jgi:hypothetical protein
MSLYILFLPDIITKINGVRYKIDATFFLSTVRDLFVTQQKKNIYFQSQQENRKMCFLLFLTIFKIHSVLFIL